MDEKIAVYLEIGKKRVFAGAVDWPAWQRSGRDEAAALQALFDYGPRYAAALRPKRLGFKAPAELAALSVVERVEGDATTDFGAPGKPASGDGEPMDEAELKRQQKILEACWRALDAAAQAAAGKELRKGPRGGGRETEEILRHVREAEASYLSLLGRKLGKEEGGDPTLARQAVLDTLAQVAASGTPEPGPRGGKRWPARYFVRRAAWHVLDHAWEIEDRAGDSEK